MGWTGGYVLMAMLLAPYLRKFGKYTVPEFVGDRYYSTAARVVAVICLIVISVTYVIGQMPVQALPSRASWKSRFHLRPLHRWFCRSGLRCARRHEGHHLHAGGAVLSF
jgi:uncharacterized sodium:solute symporter family permease YidK